MSLNAAPGCADEDVSALAEGADVVRRLALDSGLTGDLANDVYFVTLQHLYSDDEQICDHSSRRLLRTAMEQCAVARCLAWREGPSRRHGHRAPAVKS